MTCKDCIHYNACKFTYIEAFGSFPEEQFSQTGCAEFEEVMVGHWEKYPHNSGIYCSLCKKKRRYKDIHDNYCPNCGAKMDERKEK